MAGVLVGEINRNGRPLRAAGVPKAAMWTLGVVAEKCRPHNRQGGATVDYIAGATGAGERTVSRNLRALRQLGLVVVVRRGGGRGHGGESAIYRLADVDRWLTERGQPYYASDWAASAAGRDVDEPGGQPAAGGDSIPSGADERGGSIGANTAPSPDRLATSGGSIRPADAGSGGSIDDSPATSGPLSRHSYGDLPVVREELPGTPADPDATHDPIHSPSAPPPIPPTPPAFGESWCRRPDCRAPEPCRPCRDARTTHAQAERSPFVVAAERDRVRQLVARRRARERAAAIATCPRQCDAHGYLGRGPTWRLCDHTPPPDQRPGRDAAYEALATARARHGPARADPAALAS